VEKHISRRDQNPMLNDQTHNPQNLKMSTELSWLPQASAQPKHKAVDPYCKRKVWGLISLAPLMQHWQASR
jgi:hypothetical protein